MIITVLPGNLLALPFSNSFTFLLALVFSLLPGNLLTILLSSVVGHLLVLSSTILSVFSVALLPWNIFAVLLGNLATYLARNLITHLLGLAEALLLGNHRGYSLLDIMAFVDGDLTANRLVGNRADFISNIVSVGHRLGVAVLLGHLLAVFLGYLFTLLSGLVPTLLSWLIPALLMSIDIGTFLFSDSLALLLVDGAARLLISTAALLLVPGIAFLLLSVFLHRFLDSVTILVRDIMALLFCFQPTFRFSDVVNLSFRYSVANLLVVSVTFLGVLGLALLFIFG